MSDEILIARVKKLRYDWAPFNATKREEFETDDNKRGVKKNKNEF